MADALRISRGARRRAGERVDAVEGGSAGAGIEEEVPLAYGASYA